MKIISVLILFSATVAFANESDYAWDSYLTVLISKMPAQELSCGNQMFTIGGDNTSQTHLLHYLKKGLIECSAGPSVSACHFAASSSKDDEPMYDISFEISRTRHGSPNILMETLVCQPK